MTVNVAVVDVEKSNMTHENNSLKKENEKLKEGSNNLKCAISTLNSRDEAIILYLIDSSWIWNIYFSWN